MVGLIKGYKVIREFNDPLNGSKSSYFSIQFSYADATKITQSDEGISEIGR